MHINLLVAIILFYSFHQLLKDFISHPCCQKWITKKFYGGIDIREMNFGLFKIPTWMKVLVLICFNSYFKVIFKFTK